ncbi:MAG: hypothetical protein Q8P02_02620 [Candidatus Micrarchaeota archaeon]|nr:hypothetical protein [Candidatus Micrarchaeota archaeon]
MRIALFLFLAVLGTTLVEGAPASSRDYFADALSSLCAGSIGYSVRGDFRPAEPVFKP